MAKKSRKSLKTKNKRIGIKQEALQSQSKREILGVSLIAFGLFLGVSLYSDAVGIIGAAIKDCFFGIFGIVGYAIPVVLIIAGIMVIIKSKKELRSSVMILSVLAFIFLLVLFHVYYRPITSEETKILDYYRDAYSYGMFNRLGGGILGALLAYPAQILVDRVGSYIFFVAAIVIILLVITRLSLRDAAAQVGKAIKSGVDHVAQHAGKGGLYTEALKDEPKTLKYKSKRRLKRKDEDAENVQYSRAKYREDELDFMPMQGEIEKRSVQKNRIDDDEDFPHPDFGVFEQKETKPQLPGPLLFGEEAHKIQHETPVTAPQKQEGNIKKSLQGEPDIATKQKEAYQYTRPPLMLMKSPDQVKGLKKESPNERARLLEQTLASFNIEAKVTHISVGPVITRFELQPALGVRVSRITTLANDIALALAAPRVRIEAPIPGKSVIGIEIPNKSTALVLLREIVESREFSGSKSPITFALGKDIAGKIICADLDKMPHLLIAGSTGSGKSVCLNDIIISMAYKATPDEVRMILIDPKVVELKIFSTLPHLLLPVVTDPKKAAGALKWAVMEMEQRYVKMSQCNARDLARYNELQKNAEDRLPKIIIVIDELADLMMVAAKDVEEAVCRIAQLGRACGIHLIVATQRPSTDIITGLIKANIPSRIAFMVSSAVDSRVILDCNGAEKLLGKGDMLFHQNGANKPVRIQCAYISDKEVEQIMDFFGENPTEPPVDEDSILSINALDAASAYGGGKQEDDLLAEAVKIVLDSGQASISMIQRRLRVGYARAARLIDIMEQKKIVSGFDGSKPRKLLIDHAAYERMFHAAPGDDGDLEI